jgi:hypothetical protein
MEREGRGRVRDLGVEEGDGYVNVKIDDEELSDKTVNNHVTLLTTMLRTATTFKVPWLLAVPKLRKPKVALFGRDFQWLRTDDEVRRFLLVHRRPSGINSCRRPLAAAWDGSSRSS